MRYTSVDKDIDYYKGKKERKNFQISPFVKGIQIDATLFKSIIVTTEHSKAANHKEERDKVGP